MDIYESLINGNKRYGSSKEHICQSNFRCKPFEINEKVIIAPTWEVSLFSSYSSAIRHISGSRKFDNYISEIDVFGKKITFITASPGASDILDTILALGCTPCKEILFIGSVGSLDKNMNIGDIVIPKYSICGVGANRYLTIDTISNNDTYGKKYYPDKDFFNKVWESTNKIVKNENIKVHIGKTFSTDTIFAQFAHLDEFINMGCNTIEMETSTLFFASNVAKIKSASIFVVSDNTVLNKSLYSGRTNEEQQRRYKVKKDIIPRIALDVLLK